MKNNTCKAIIITSTIIGILIAMIVVFVLASSGKSEYKCNDGMSKQVDGDTIIYTYLPANDTCNKK